MKFRASFAALGAVVLLSACAAGVSPATTGKKAGPIACDTFLKQDSFLAADLKSYSDTPACSREYHPGGGGYYEVYSLAGRSKVAGANVPDQTWILIFRVYGGNGSGLERINSRTFEHIENYTDLADDLTADLPGLVGGIPAKTFELSTSGLAIVCLDALTSNKDGSRSVVDVCRSAGKGATTAERLALANEIAAKDLPGISP